MPERTVAQDVLEIRGAEYARTVREAIAHGIEACYDDVTDTTLRVDAYQTAIQNEITAGRLPSYTVADGTFPGAKLTNGSVTKEKLASDVSFDVDDTLTQTGEAADAKATGDAVNMLKRSLNKVEGLTPMDASLFEKGSITIKYTGQSGASEPYWAYADSNIRYRTKEGTTISLNPGDVVGLFDNTNYRMYIGWRTGSEGSYTYDSTRAWFAHDEFHPSVSGEYVILLAKKVESGSLNKSVSELIYIRKDKKIESIYEDGWKELGFLSRDGSATTNLIDIDYEDRITDFIEVSPSSKYTLASLVRNKNGASFNPSFGLCWYTEGKIIVGARIIWDTVVSSGQTYEMTVFDDYAYLKTDVTSPSTAKYCRFTARTFGDAIFAIQESQHWDDIVMFRSYANHVAVENDKISYQILRTQTLEDRSFNPYDRLIRNISHRGYQRTAPENTLPAYLEAKKHGYYFVETDVRKTADGVYVLLHNLSINATARYKADGSQIPGTVNITSLTYEQANDLYDYRGNFGEQYAGVEIPTLESLLVLCKKIGMHPYIEMKYSTINVSDVPNIVDMVKDCGMQGNVTYFCTEPAVLYAVQKCDKFARIGYVLNSYSANSAVPVIRNLRDGGYNEAFVSVEASSITSSVIDSCKLNNIPIETWTVDIEVEAKMDKLRQFPYISGAVSNYEIVGKALYEETMGSDFPMPLHC